MVLDAAAVGQLTHRVSVRGSAATNRISAYIVITDIWADTAPSIAMDTIPLLRRYGSLRSRPSDITGDEVVIFTEL